MGKRRRLCMLMLLPIYVFVNGCGSKKNEIVFYVSPDGYDKWEGNLARANPLQFVDPFASIEKARNAVREIEIHDT